MQQPVSSINQIGKHSSNVFWRLKGFAIFTVFFAHMPAHELDCFINMPYIYDVIGMCGVPLFLMIAGYFDFYTKTPLIKRARKLFIPLLVWGTITFLIHILKSPSEAHLKDYLMWIYGCGSWLYFVPVLFWCMLFSRIGSEWLWIVLGLISSCLSTFDIIPYNQIFTPYINPFNFIVYFCIGRLFRKYDIVNTILNKSLLWLLGTLFVMIVFLSLTKPNYWMPWTFFFSISFFIFCYLVFDHIPSKWLVEIGKMSYVIYLCHIQIAGFVHFKLQMLWGTPYETIKVFVAFGIVSLFCYVLKYYLVKFEASRVLGILGYR